MDNKSKPERLDNDPEVDTERNVYEGEPIWRGFKNEVREKVQLFTYFDSKVQLFTYFRSKD